MFDYEMLKQLLSDAGENVSTHWLETLTPQQLKELILWAGGMNLVDRDNEAHLRPRPDFLPPNR